MQNLLPKFQCERQESKYSHWKTDVPRFLQIKQNSTHKVVSSKAPRRCKTLAVSKRLLGNNNDEQEEKHPVSSYSAANPSPLSRLARGTDHFAIPSNARSKTTAPWLKEKRKVSPVHVQFSNQLNAKDIDLYLKKAKGLSIQSSSLPPGRSLIRQLAGPKSNGAPPSTQDGIRLAFVNGSPNDLVSDPDGRKFTITFFNGALNGPCDVYWVNSSNEIEHEITMTTGSTHTVETKTQTWWIIHDRATQRSVTVIAGDAAVEAQTQFSLVYDPQLLNLSLMAKPIANAETTGLYDSILTLSILPLQASS